MNRERGPVRHRRPRDGRFRRQVASAQAGHRAIARPACSATGPESTRTLQCPDPLRSRGRPIPGAKQRGFAWHRCSLCWSLTNSSGAPRPRSARCVGPGRYASGRGRGALRSQVPRFARPPRHRRVSQPMRHGPRTPALRVLAAEPTMSDMRRTWPRRRSPTSQRCPSRPPSDKVRYMRRGVPYPRCR